MAVKTSIFGGLQADNIVWEGDVEFRNMTNIPCALLDTRLLPGRPVSNHLTDTMLKNVFDAVQKSNFPDVLKLAKMWTFIADSKDAKVVRNSLGSIFCDKKGFSVVEAYYRPHCDEESVKDNVNGFRKRHMLVLFHILWPRDIEKRDFMLKGVHIAEELPRYLFPHMITMERQYAVFKEELRMQAYIDIIGQMSIPGATFVNICGGSKPHLIAKAFKMGVVSIVPLENISRAIEVSSRFFCLENWLANSRKLAERLQEFLSKPSPVTEYIYEKAESTSSRSQSDALQLLPNGAMHPEDPFFLVTARRTTEDMEARPCADVECGNRDDEVILEEKEDQKITPSVTKFYSRRKKITRSHQDFA